MIENLHEIFDYCPETGVVTWKVSVGRRVRVGEVAGKPDALGHFRVGLRYKKLYVHRLIWALHTGKWPVQGIDHINGNPSDNRICNLREATRQQNGFNSKIRKNNSTGVRGVRKKRYGKYVASISMNHKRIYLGRFDLLEDAAAAYDAAAKTLFGEYRRRA